MSPGYKHNDIVTHGNRMAIHFRPTRFPPITEDISLRPCDRNPVIIRLVCNQDYLPPEVLRLLRLALWIQAPNVRHVLRCVFPFLLDMDHQLSAAFVAREFVVNERFPSASGEKISGEHQLVQRKRA